MKLRPHLYVLDANGEPLPIESEDVLVWAQWFEHNHKARVVAQTQIGPYFVSTVFLGIDMSFMPDGPLVLWETMVFAKEKQHDSFADLDCRRYSSKQEAMEGHAATCLLVSLEVEKQEGKRPDMVHRITMPDQS